MSTINITSVPAHGSGTVVSDADANTDVTLNAPNNADVTKSTSLDVPANATGVASVSSIEQQKEHTMAEHHYRLKVQMTCGGCSGAVTRVLNKAKETGAGVSSFNVSLENQSVDVYGTIGFNDLTLRIEKTGKRIIEREEVVETPAEAEAEVETPPAAETETTPQAVAVA